MLGDTLFIKIQWNWKDVDQLKEEMWMQTFLETICMEGAATNLSEVYNEEKQKWEVIIDIVP